MPNPQNAAVKQIRTMRPTDVSGERTIRVPKDQLLTRLRANRLVHANEHANAIQQYKKELSEKIRTFSVKVVTELRKRETELNQLLDREDWQEHFQHNYVLLSRELEIHLYRPLSFLHEYDRAITIFEWELDEEVYLTLDEFEKYINDNWEWSDMFDVRTKAYSAKFKA